MNKFTRAMVEHPGCGLDAALECMKPHKGGGGGDTSTTSEPPEHLQGAYKQYGQALTGTGGTAATPARWVPGNEGWDPGNDVWENGGSGSAMGGYMHPGSPGTPAQGGFMQEYNPEWYEGKTLANVPEFMQRAMKDYRSNYGGTSNQLKKAKRYNNSVLAGDYLGLSDSMRGAVMNPAMDAMASRAEGMGRYGSAASGQQMGLAGMQAVMPYYDAERSRQGEAAKRATLFDQLRYDRRNEQNERQMQMGEFRMGRQQDRLDEKRQAFEFEQNKYYDKMMKYGQLLSPGSQYGITTQEGGGGSRAAGIAGGALSGAAMGSSFGLPGAAAGAVIGGIGGAM